MLRVFNKLFLVFVIVLNISGCGDATDPYYGLSNFFYASAKSTGPTISASTTSLKANEITNGSTLKIIYDILRNYSPSTESEIVDNHNFYKVLYSSGQIYATALNYCTLLNNPINLFSPFNLGATSLYKCAGSMGNMTDTSAYGYAVNEENSTYHGLLTYRYASDATVKTENGILVGNYNDTNGDLTLNTLHLTNNASEAGYVLRTRLVGNSLSHSFNINFIYSNLSNGITGTSTTTWTSVVGKGISDYLTNYYLLKFTNSVGQTGYFCIPAKATEATLAELNLTSPTGSTVTTVDANCAAYLADVDNMAFMTTTDVPKSIEDFKNSAIWLREQE